MSVELLLKEFHRISEASDAVAKLRRFIVDLAVRGKLVEQNEADEPASKLFKRIQDEKRQQARARNGSRGSAAISRTIADPPFLIPSTWMWVPVRQITSDRGQKIPDKKFQYIDVSAINKEKGIIAEPQILLPGKAPSRARKIVRRGDVLYSCVRPYLLNIAVVDEDFAPEPIASTAFAVLNGFGLLSSHYLWAVLRSTFFIEAVEQKMRGQAYPAINDGDFALLPIPLAPLEEQNRIASRLKELFTLCDEIESSHNHGEAHRDKLVRASLARLTTAAYHNSFRESARFYFKHLPHLTTRPEHLHSFKKATIDLAIQGRLPTQDGSDEPASALIKYILSEKRRLGVKTQIIGSSTIESEAPFALPSSWAWARYGDVAVSFRYGTSKLCSYEKNGTPVLRIPNVSSGKMSLDDLKYAVLTARETNDLSLRAGDILMIRSNGSLNLVGRPAIVDKSAAGFCYAGYLVRVRFFPGTVDSRYITMVLNSTFVRSQIEGPIRSTVGLKNVNSTEFSNLRIPLPPVDEQARIVRVVERLAELCSACATQITTEAQARQQLLNVTLQQALASSKIFPEIAAGA